MAADARSAHAADANAAIDRVAAWTQAMRRCRAFPTSSSARDGASARIGAICSSALADARAGGDRTALRRRRPAHPQHAACPTASMARARSAVWPLSRMPLLIPEAEWREIARGVEQRAELMEARARRRLWRRRAGRRGRAARRRAHRLAGLPRRDARRQAAGRALAAPLRRRHRPRPGRALVGARRPRPGAVRRRLCAGEPAGASRRPFRASTAR